MKHFLPSSVMLTPFLVKYYDDDESQESIDQSEVEEHEQDGDSLSDS
ncbi:hypothetical protein [Vibrio profundi]